MDFVLAFNGLDEKEDHIKKRATFEDNLRKEGLHLEYDNTQHVHFVKIHAPRDVLYRYAEILKIKLPMRKVCSLERAVEQWSKPHHFLPEIFVH